MGDNPLRLRITGDIHTPNTISIIDVATGKEVTNVLEVDIHIARPDESTVTLKLWGCELDLTGNVMPKMVDGELVTSEVELE